MRYELWLGIRYLFGRSREKFISLITLISIVGIAIGVAALIIVIGVMSGFDNELREKIIGTNSHLIVDKIGGLDDAPQIMETLLSLPRVEAAAPFVATQALLVDHEHLFSVDVRGIDPEREIRVTALKKFIENGALNLDGNALIIGKELARRLMLEPGDEVRLVFSARSAGELFTVTGIFNTGMYDYDSRGVLMNLSKAREFTETPEIVSGVSVRIDDVYKAEAVKKQIQNLLGFPYYTRTWMDFNRNLFNALRLEKTAMFIILTLIVLVAALNIASTLIMMVMEKTKDIGILKAVGSTAKSIRLVFTFAGICIGTAGTICGTILGLGMAYVLKTHQFIQLPKDIYYIDRLPVLINAADVLIITGAAFCISLAATVYPAYQAARLNPVEALRYE